ncbi:hypothetical protein HYX14_00365 [Candidatus Woesearchaeota archaeon]|nr:hypothetical protein [Candidatus Woesearchaeota archaeon]
MAEPTYHLGVSLDTVVSELHLSQPWNAESAKSSTMTVVPSAGIIKKVKNRKLDSTLYEAYATIFFSELFKQYNDLFQTRDFTIYTPQVLFLEYGDIENQRSMKSALFEFFCPGLPLNKVVPKRERLYKVDGDDVRADQRALYLSGIFSQILQQEGVMHGDLQLRHVILLPPQASLQYINRDGAVLGYDARNGLGVIDVENARLESPSAEEVVNEQNRFKSRLFKRFTSTPDGEAYFSRGSKLVAEQCSGMQTADVANRIAQQVFEQRFQPRCNVNIRERKVEYRK